MKKLLIFSFLAVLAAGASGQPELPHRVYGQVTDGGAQVQGVNVSASCTGCWSITNSDGFYDLDLSGGQYSSGEKVFLRVSGQNSSRYVNFTSGASERIDFSGSYSTGDEQDNTTETSPGSPGSPSGGTGGSSNSGPSSSPPSGGTNSFQEELSFEVSLDENNSASLDMGDLKDGQSVNVRVTGEETYLEGFSFDVTQDSTSTGFEVVSTGDRPSSVVEPGFDVFRYYRIDLEGVQEFTGASVSYQLSKPWLISRTNSSDSFVFSGYSGSWNRVSSSVVTETLSVYSLESGVSSFGLFATGVEQVSESTGSSGVTVRDFSVQSSDSDPFRVDISATVVNQGNTSVSENLTLYSGQRRLEVAEVSLDPGQSRVFTFSSNLSAAGPHSFRFGSETATVTVDTSDQDRDGGGLSLILLGAGGALLLFVTLLIGYIYFIEYRRAKELDETVDYLEKQSDRVGKRMEDVRRDLNTMQSQLGRRDRDEGDRS